MYDGYADVGVLGPKSAGRGGMECTGCVYDDSSAPGDE